MTDTCKLLRAPTMAPATISPTPNRAAPTNNCFAMPQPTTATASPRSPAPIVPTHATISNAIAAQEADTELNDRNLSAFIYVWGQFLDHDIDLTDSTDNAKSAAIAVPTGDAYFDPTAPARKRSLSRVRCFDPTTGTSTSNPREQINAYHRLDRRLA